MRGWKVAAAVTSIAMAAVMFRTWPELRRYRRLRAM